jgi:uncharacterized protein (DUF305 family)
MPSAALTLAASVLAGEIIKAREAEIAWMQAWLKKRGR